MCELFGSIYFRDANQFINIVSKEKIAASREARLNIYKHAQTRKKTMEQYKTRDLRRENICASSHSHDLVRHSFSLSHYFYS